MALLAWLPAGFAAPLPDLALTDLRSPISKQGDEGGAGYDRLILDSHRRRGGLLQATCAAPTGLATGAAHASGAADHCPMRGASVLLPGNRVPLHSAPQMSDIEDARLSAPRAQGPPRA